MLQSANDATVAHFIYISEANSKSSHNNIYTTSTQIPLLRSQMSHVNIKALKQDFHASIKFYHQVGTLTFAAKISRCFTPQSPQRSGQLSSLHLVCQQVLPEHPLCKEACLSQDEITQKDPLHTPQDKEKPSVGQMLTFFHGLHWGIPHCIPQCWHVGESTPFSVIYEWLQAQMWICRRWQSEGRQTPVYQREELKGAAPGETHHFTSIALCGRHFKGTSSLKTWGWTFMCGRIYLPHHLYFMWFSDSLCLTERPGRPHALPGFACASV